MKPGSIEKLKFDKRLSRRRGWISEEEVSVNLESLPDVSDKLTTGDGSDSEESEGFDEGVTSQSAPAVAAAEPVSPEAASPSDEV